MTDLKSLTIEELGEYFSSIGEPSFRAKQVFTWIHAKKVRSFSEMRNLPKRLQDRLGETAELTTASSVCMQESKEDATRKYLLRFPDGEMVEAVYMLHDYGISLCISTQVGCRMGCKFCASTLKGLSRSLTAGEMLEEIYFIEKDTGKNISHLVLMGSGEPLDNYDSVIKFLRLLNQEEGRNLSLRNVTLSTVGITEKMRMLAEENLPVTLAVSLHAPNDEIRKKLLPMANRYVIEEIIRAADYYFQKTGRRISYEYSLVSGINDSKECAEELSRLLIGHSAHVNLISVNPVKENTFKGPQEADVFTFQKVLEKNGINATIRRGFGKDIDGACGQLRNRAVEEKNEVRRKNP